MPDSSTMSVRVELAERSYDVSIASGLIDRAAAILRPCVQCSKALVITDSNVGPLYGERCVEQIGELCSASLLEVPAGEVSKSIRQAESLWEQALSAGAGRDTLVVGLGGGVVGDLAGFVAATFARGLALVQIPTSLLAQVDSSVGGKVGINLSSAKNMVGAFWQPRAVIVDLDVLNTLPPREFAAGLAEVIKYGVIHDGAFFERLELGVEGIRERDPEFLTEIVARCCEIKAEVVAADETERAGRREILNYGHTFAHAIEAISGYGEHLHGEAVAMGMMCAARLALRLGMIDESVVERQQNLLAKCDLPTAVTDVDPQQMLRLMRTDKKAREGRIRFVLPTTLGSVKVVDQVADDLVVESIVVPS